MSDPYRTPGVLPPAPQVPLLCRLGLHTWLPGVEYHFGSGKVACMHCPAKKTERVEDPYYGAPDNDEEYEP